MFEYSAQSISKLVLLLFPVTIRSYLTDLIKSAMEFNKKLY